MCQKDNKIKENAENTTNKRQKIKNTRKRGKINEV